METEIRGLRPFSTVTPLIHYKQEVIGHEILKSLSYQRCGPREFTESKLITQVVKYLRLGPEVNARDAETNYSLQFSQTL